MSRSILFAYILFALLLALSPSFIYADEVINELSFTVDLTEIYGTGLGYFDPLEDVLDLMGLDWVGATVIEDESERRFEQDPFNPGIFYTLMVIRGQEGDSTKWKCKAEPEARFYNWGWEISPDYWYTIQEDGFVADIELKPNIFPIQPAIDLPVTILFQVDMSNATNYYTQEIIDPVDVEWVGLKGQNSVLGSWAGSWLPADTASTPRTLQVLRDNGMNGDKVADDFIFSAFVEFPAGNEGGPGLFKYGAFYDGALDANNGQTPLDNEMHGTDHWINVKVGGQQEILNRFGVIEAITRVAQKKDPFPHSLNLEQNYPNPFNPSTTINYVLSSTSYVELSIFNIYGQKVASLVDDMQHQGSHSVIFEASDLSSGIYLYQLLTKDSYISRKMILVK